MPSITYTAKREIEPTGFAKTGTDFSAIGSDDSIDAVSTNLSGLLTDQWLQAAGFVRNAGWFQVKSNSTSAKILTLTPPVTRLRLPGVSGNDATTPDSAAVSITGDIDLRARIAPTDWTNTAGTQEIIAKSATDSSQFSYLLRLNSDGTLTFYWSSDGSALLNGTSTVATGFVDGTTHWIRATLDVNNGAAGRDIRFYTSDDGIIWTQLGATVTQGTATSIFDGTASLRVGMRNTASNGVFTGRIYYAEIRTGFDGTGTVVAAFDPTRGTRGAGSLVALTGETWTINTSGTPPALLQGPLIQDEGAEYLSSLNGYATTPDSAAISVTGNIELTTKVRYPNYSAPATSSGILSKDDGATNRDYNLYLHTDGKLHFLYSTDGSTITGRDAASTVAVSFPANADAWFKATYNTGTGVVQFLTSSDGVIFTQLGTNVPITSGAIHNGTGQLVVGSTSFPGSRIYYGEVRNGIGGPVVAAFDSARAPAGAATLVAYTGETWMVGGSGVLTRTTPVTVTGYMRGYGQSYGLDFNASALQRSTSVKRNVQQPIGGGAPEVLLNRSESTIDVTTQLLSDAQLLQWREILASVAAGEIFTFDPYGTIASPIEPHQAMLESEQYTEARLDVLMLYRISFTVRLLT